MITHSMFERNRDLLAARTGWPPGALDSVRAIEKANPGYSVSWFNDWTLPGWERAAGFYAWREGDQPGWMGWRGNQQVWVGRNEVYGATADQLAEALGGKLP